MGNEGKEEMRHSGDHHGSSSEPQAAEFFSCHWGVEKGNAWTVVMGMQISEVVM